MYAIIDCNSFYVSCERAFRPDLRTKPVVVLSNNDGCVISRSAEAKLLGIPMGAPAFKFKKIFKEKQIKVFSSNYSLYGDMSSRVMEVLKQFAPEVEVYSIDEAFLLLENLPVDIETYAHQIKKTIFQYTNIPVSVGVAPTKALSKVANHVAKKFQQKTKGVFVIDTEERRVKTLKWMPIAEVWGIGRGHHKRLSDLGIGTAYEFTQLSESWVKKNMSVIGLRLQKDLKGEATMTLDDDTRDKKAIATTRSFEYTYKEYEEVKERIVTFAYSCAEKLRKQKSACTHAYVFLRSNRHDSSKEQYRAGTMVAMPYPTDSTLVIVNTVVKGLKEIFKANIHYKRAGVVLTGLTTTKQVQLFANEDPKHESLMKIMDGLNDKFGAHKIKIASQDLERTWKMRQEHLSPQYTTKLSEIIEVNCNERE